MSIKIKLIAVFSLLFLMVMAIVFYSRTNISASADLIEQTYDKPLMASNFARDSLIGFLRLQDNVSQYGYDEKKFRSLYNDVSSSLDVVQERMVSQRSQPFLDKSRALLKQWADAVAAQDLKAAKETGAAFESKTDLLIENEFAAAHDYVIDTRAKVDHYNTVLLVLNGVCLFFSFAGGVYLFLSVYRPIKACIAISENIASGHFDQAIAVRGSLEFRYLLAALKEMQTKLIWHIEERQKVLNCLGQGFLMFDRQGICTPVYSRSCQTLLETTPPGKHIADILHLDDNERGKFERLLKLAFDPRHVESLDLFANFAPHTYRHSQGMHVRIDYKSDSSTESQTPDHIIVIATDITKQVQAQKLADDQKSALESIERVLRDKRSFGAYMRRSLEFAENLQLGSASQLTAADIKREAHTLKGGAGVFRLTAFMQALHDFETALAATTSPDAPAAGLDPVLRQHGAILDHEIGLIKKQFDDLLGVDIIKLETAGSLDRATVFAFADYLATQGLDELRQAYIRQVCMESIRDTFKRFNTYLEDLAGRLNKKVAPIRFAGEDIAFLPENYKGLLDSLTHIFRNIMDHGIEPPDRRRASGKDENGQIEIDFKISPDAGNRPWLEIMIKDDGAGIDVGKVRDKLQLADPSGHWLHRDDAEVFNQMLTATISTSDTITHYSGRGIGLQAVYHEVTRLAGTFSLDSTPGRGAQFTIKVPYNADIVGYENPHV